MVALVLALLLEGADGLRAFGTGPGALAFLWLWGIATWTTREALKPALQEGARPAPILVGAAFWGSVTGVGFLVGVVAGTVVATREPGILLFLAFGAVAAAIVGAVAGLAAGILDLALLALLRRAAR